jgi:hypothetical protein
MRLSTRLGTAGLAIALVGGLGLAGAPAQAKTTKAVSGQASLAFLPSVLTSLSLLGVQFGVTPPAAIVGDGGAGQTLVFPMARPAKGGVVTLTGGMSVGAFISRLYLTTPRLNYAGAQGQITFEVIDMPADGPAELTNGTRIALFEVSSLKSQTKKGRVSKSGKTWTRTDTQRITGQVSLTDDTALLTSINSYIGTSFFTPGLPFGTLTTVITTKVTCSTAAECR